MVKLTKYSLIVLLLFGECLLANETSTKPKFESCTVNPKIFNIRSEEIQSIVHQDQLDRKLPANLIDWNEVQKRDLERIVRISEIFAEGCFRSAKDYAAAALVFQHGTTADHSFQTYIWAKKAVELGDLKSKSLMACGVDRFLIRSGKKQLFGTQSGGIKNTRCLCLEPVDESFSEDKRKSLSGKSLKDNLDWITRENLNRPNCNSLQTTFCDHKLNDIPKGFVPGLF